MNFKHFLESMGVGMAVAVFVLVVGVGGDAAWAVWKAQARSTDGFVYAEFNVVLLFILAAVGLIVGFWWAYRRDSTRALRRQFGEAS
jgi:hypothetical protein